MLQTPCRTFLFSAPHTFHVNSTPPESEFLRLLAGRLTAARKARGMSIADVSRAMPEVSPAIVGHWFRGVRKPQVDNLRKIAELLDVSMATLLEGDAEYAVSKEERAALEMLRSMAPEMRQAMLALMKAQTSKS